MTFTSRQHLVVRLPLAALGASMPPETLMQRIQNKKSELFLDIPIFSGLRSSVLVMHHEVCSTGVWLGVYLVETNQMSLQFPANDLKRPQLNDLFSQEFELVKKQQATIEQRVLKAISPAIDPTMDNEIQNLRKRLKRTRRDEGFLLASGPEPERFSCDNLPKVMPRGFELEVRVRINCLSRNKAEVTVREVMNQEDDGTVYITPNRKIDLLRQGAHRQPASGQRIQEAMDTRRDLKILVTVALNWIDGQPLYLELVDFIDDRVNQA